MAMIRCRRALRRPEHRRIAKTGTRTSQGHRLRTQSLVPDERESEHEATHHEEDQYPDRSSTEEREGQVRVARLARRSKWRFNDTRMRRDVERDGCVVRDDEGDREEAQSIDLGDPTTSARSPGETREQRVTPAPSSAHLATDVMGLDRSRQ